MLFRSNSVEWTNFYIWQNNVSASASQFAGIDTLFFNPPIGFLGNNLFDGNLLRRTSTVFSLEFLAFGKPRPVSPGREREDSSSTPAW